MDLSIIIINYNTKLLTKECIESIYQMTKDVKFEVIVIDNASTDGSFEELSKLNYENFKYIYNDINLGFSKANNQGSTLSSGKYLFFMNSDMVFINDVAGKLVHYLKINKNAGIIGPKFLNPDQTLQISCRNFPSIQFGLIKFFPFLKKVFKNEYNKYYNKNYDYSIINHVDTISAGALLISKSDFDRIGKFDEFSFMYGEDADICKRVRDIGKYIVFYPSAQLIHYGGQSSKLNSTKAIWSYYMAFYYLYKKYYFKNFSLIVKPLFVFRALIELVVNYFRKDKRITWNTK